MKLINESEMEPQRKIETDLNDVKESKVFIVDCL